TDQRGQRHLESFGRCASRRVRAGPGGCGRVRERGAVVGTEASSLTKPLAARRALHRPILFHSQFPVHSRKPSNYGFGTTCQASSNNPAVTTSAARGSLFVADSLNTA